MFHIHTGSSVLCPSWLLRVFVFPKLPPAPCAAGMLFASSMAAADATAAVAAAAADAATCMRISECATARSNVPALLCYH